MSKIYTQKEAVAEGYTTTVRKYAKQTGWSQGHITVCIRRGEIPAVKTVNKKGGKAIWMLDPDSSKIWKKEGGRKIVQKRHSGQEIAGRYVFQPDQPGALDLAEEGAKLAEKQLADCMGADLYGAYPPMEEEMAPRLKQSAVTKDTVLDMIAICRTLLNVLQNNLGE